MVYGTSRKNYWVPQEINPKKFLIMDYNYKALFDTLELPSMDNKDHGLETLGLHFNLVKRMFKDAKSINNIEFTKWVKISHQYTLVVLPTSGKHMITLSKIHEFLGCDYMHNGVHKVKTTFYAIASMLQGRWKYTIFLSYE